MESITDSDTHTISVMAATQLVKTELLINVASYYIHQDPSPILFIQPTQSAAESFSKERFAPTVLASPALRELVQPPRSRDSENTIAHKSYPGGSLDFVGANSPTDLASRPKRVILADEIDKYPISAGSEGDPLKLGEERASTYRALGRAKFVRTCSPTVEGISRIGREYAASDRRRCFLACQHCGHEQVLTWSHVRWDKDGSGANLPETARLACEACGTIWSERDRVASLDALETAPGYGWRQTREFSCCDQQQVPEQWDHAGRARCYQCGKRAPYGGHAGFHVSKLYSKRHRLPEIVSEFLEAQGEPELLRKFTNTALAELWKPQYGDALDSAGLIARAEVYGPDDLPDEVIIITGFCDVQGNRLEVQLIGWGRDEEAWPFQYTIINQDPSQPMAWAELDVLLTSKFRTRSGQLLRVAAFGVDTGGHHGSQVYAFAKARRGRRIFATKGIHGNRPIWSGRETRSKMNDPLWLIGTDAAKDAIYGRLKIDPPEPGLRKPGFIHFPTGENFGPDYYEQLTSERRMTHKRMGQPYTRWELPEGKRNEVLDTFVGALAVRRSLPRRIEVGLQYSVVSERPPRDGAVAPAHPAPPTTPAQRPMISLAPTAQAPRRSFASMLPK
jgi:phage terminase large subunit GpA-like protein